MLIFPLLRESSQSCWSCCLSTKARTGLGFGFTRWLFWGARRALLHSVKSLKRLQSFLKEKNFFIFSLTLTNLDDMKGTAASQPCCRSCVVKIKSGRGVELHLKSPSVRSEWQSRHAAPGSTAHFQSLFPRSLFQFILTPE